MGKSSGITSLQQSLRQIGSGLKETFNAEARTMGRQARNAMLEGMSSTRTQAEGSPTSLRKTASELRARMNRPTATEITPENVVGAEMLARGLRRTSEALGDLSRSQSDKVRDRMELRGDATGLRTHVKKGFKNGLQQKFAAQLSPLAAMVEQGNVHVRQKLHEHDAMRLSGHSAAILSSDDLDAFKSGLKALPARMQAGPLFALALNSMSYPPELRQQAKALFQELRNDIPDDGAGRLSAIANQPADAHEDAISAQAWLLASAEERDLVGRALELQGRDRGQIESLVVRSSVTDEQVASKDVAVLARSLSIETEDGLQALQARRNQLPAAADGAPAPGAA
ncbi:hypothetical protein [Ramlibacter tataouinensis]|uniref:Uncharacterized protein n=1 Tax=Ramlibacter tataouinensis (strain ATCC BAA-407 / DSM 14655 / LMG 21543 / TTB310) TaxID=365046 RepID=F5XVX7_RAMTT|nr:hypothetical protein [Ramlibacter tataouinensis]AEG94080.1 hypothetical protein Rta_29760 [Ramlibacter tataouinensis TTB310]